jgi:hypothetical protein
VDDSAWILRDGDRDLVRLEDPVEREKGWFAYRVVPLSVERLHEYLGSQPGAEDRLSAFNEARGERAERVQLDRSKVDGEGRLLVRGLGPKKRGLWAVVFEWMSRM